MLHSIIEVKEETIEEEEQKEMPIIQNQPPSSRLMPIAPKGTAVMNNILGSPATNISHNQFNTTHGAKASPNSYSYTVSYFPKAPEVYQPEEDPLQVKTHQMFDVPFSSTLQTVRQQPQQQVQHWQNSYSILYK